MVKNKKCDCGHSKNEHMLTQKNMSVLDIVLFHDRVATLQEGVGECMKCYCPEYKSPSKFNARRGVITHYEQQRMMFLKKDVLDVDDF
jgi:hypothetical protein